MVKTIPMKSIYSAEVPRHFVNNWEFNYDHPAYLLSDNGVAFTSKFFQDVQTDEYS